MKLCHRSRPGIDLVFFFSLEIGITIIMLPISMSSLSLILGVAGIHLRE